MTREKHKIASFVRRRYGWKTLMLSVAFAVTICPYSANAEEQAVDAFDDAAYVNEATDINEIEYINETEDVEDSSNLDEFMSDIELDYISANPDPADFSEIDELLAQVPPKLYRFSDASAKALQDAIDAIERNRTSEDQEEVDGWAADLRSALEGLTKAGWHTTDQGIWYCYEDQKTWPVSKWEKIDGVYRLVDCSMTGYNLVGDLNLSSCSELKSISIEDNSISQIELNSFHLTVVNVSSNNLSSLDVSNLATLESLSCSDNELSSLDVSNNLRLIYLDCSNNNVSTVSLEDNWNLTTLKTSGTSIDSLDVSHNSVLHSLSPWNTELAFVKLPSGFADIVDLSASSANSFSWVKAGEQVEENASYQFDGSDVTVVATLEFDGLTQKIIFYVGL